MTKTKLPIIYVVDYKIHEKTPSSEYKKYLKEQGHTFKRREGVAITHVSNYTGLKEYVTEHEDELNPAEVFVLTDMSAFGSFDMKTEAYIRKTINKRRYRIVILNLLDIKLCDLLTECEDSKPDYPIKAEDELMINDYTHASETDPGEFDGECLHVDELQGGIANSLVQSAYSKQVPTEPSYTVPEDKLALMSAYGETIDFSEFYPKSIIKSTPTDKVYYVKKKVFNSSPKMKTKLMRELLETITDDDKIIGENIWHADTLKVAMAHYEKMKKKGAHEYCVNLYVISNVKKKHLRMKSFCIPSLIDRYKRTKYQRRHVPYDAVRTTFNTTINDVIRHASGEKISMLKECMENNQSDLVKAYFEFTDDRNMDALKEFVELCEICITLDSIKLYPNEDIVSKIIKVHRLLVSDFNPEEMIRHDLSEASLYKIDIINGLHLNEHPLCPISNEECVTFISSKWNASSVENDIQLLMDNPEALTYILENPVLVEYVGLERIVRFASVTDEVWELISEQDFSSDIIDASYLYILIDFILSAHESGLSLEKIIPLAVNNGMIFEKELRKDNIEDCMSLITHPHFTSELLNHIAESSVYRVIKLLDSGCVTHLLTAFRNISDPTTKAHIIKEIVIAIDHNEISTFELIELIVAHLISDNDVQKRVLSFDLGICGYSKDLIDSAHAYLEENNRHISWYNIVNTIDKLVIDSAQAIFIPDSVKL